MSSAARSGFNLNIHGLRGIAASMVFIFHIYDNARKLDANAEPTSFALNAFMVSYASGVDLFFMISGLLITASLIRHGQVRSFLVDRVIRVYPVFLFLHVCLFVAASLLGYQWLRDVSISTWLYHFTTNLFLLPGVFDLPLLQAVAWSLSYEFAFYLTAAAVYFFWGRQKWGSWAILPLFVLTMIWIHPRAVFFLAGVATYFLLQQPRDIKKHIDALGLIGLASFIAVCGYANATGQDRLVYLALFGGFVFFYATASGAPGLSRFLQLRPVLYMGTISYSFYLWHPVITFPIKHLTSNVLVGRLDWPPSIAIPCFCILSLALTLVAAHFSYVYLEQRAGRWLKSRAERYELRPATT